MSVASTLNMTHLTDLAAGMGADSADHKPIFKMLQDSAVVRQFKELGYRYLHIGSWYGETRTDSAADRNLFVGGPSDFGATLFDTTALPRVLNRLHLAPTKRPTNAPTRTGSSAGTPSGPSATRRAPSW
jgi:hypothetical protein